MRIGFHPAAILWILSLAALATGCGSSDGETPAAADSPAAEASNASTPTVESVAVAANATEDLHPIVEIETNLGPIKLRLDAEHAPVTVRNFLQYVTTGYYQKTIFHQVEQGYMVLGGAYTADLEEKPAEMPIRNEAHNGLKNKRGTIAMFRYPDQIDSASSQFYINLADNPHLDYQGGHPEQDASDDADWSHSALAEVAPADYGYCVFGEVIEGLEIVEKISQSASRSVQEFANVPVQPISIESVRVLR